ncbi:hypothetical protein [Cystobacter fuscus]|uniref:hypothetical protein n=1 Tax=Cystobacter fuscus TaxID=43 RepID=UPI002B2D85E0|nr:hypothetical protein F0U63_07390 [Cystobacter fuscus]
MAPLPSRVPPPRASLLSGARHVLRTPHFIVQADDFLGILLTERTDVPYASIQELEDVMDELCDTLDEQGRARYALLADLRAAPGRNDPAFEATMNRLTPRWCEGFRKVGVLVQTVIGQMQVQRYARQDGIERLITTNEAQLLDYLTAE